MSILRDSAGNLLAVTHVRGPVRRRGMRGECPSTAAAWAAPAPRYVTTLNRASPSRAMPWSIGINDTRYRGTVSRYSYSTDGGEDS